MTREATPFAGRLGRREDEVLVPTTSWAARRDGRVMQLRVGHRKQTGFLASCSHGCRALLPCQKSLVSKGLFDYSTCFFAAQRLHRKIVRKLTSY
jgi:hypothetical protein